LNKESYLILSCASTVVRLELRADEISPFVHEEDGAFGKLEQLSIVDPTEDFLNNTGKLPILKHLSVTLGYVKPRVDIIFNFFSKFSTTLEVLNLDHDFDFCRSPE